ncbi:MAG TPA: IS1634 family transposase [Solirubrobacteraceae bacterium]|nr:IS1634 family transposase [Solirubrobacteraceae bacterium]
MHVAKISRRHGEREYNSYLVRRSVREGRRVRHETVANVSGLPPEAIEALTLALRGVTLVPAGEAFEIVRSRKHGHVEAVLTAARRLGVARLLDRVPSRERDLCLAMIAGRVLDAGSKLACTRQLHSCTLGEELGVQGAVHDDLYAAMDWLLGRQDAIEQRLARRHLKEGELALYDVSCSYFEGRTCPLARFGYDHGSGKRGRMQVEYGLVCDSDGRPVAIDAFEGSLKDSQTLPSQVKKLEQRFGLSRVIVVSDRGIGTKENVTLISETAEFGFITALKAPQVRALVKEGCLQLSVFDELNLAEIACEKLYPGQRLVVCRNPLVAEERTRKRRELLAGTEKDLGEIKRRVEAGTLQGEAEIGLAVGAVWNRYKVKKHFQVNITDDTFTYERKQEQIALETELDGIYVIRAGRIDCEELAAGGIVRAYKQLKEAEKGFGGLKGPLEVRPIHHRLEDRVRCHLLICMLAEYVRWHLRHAWAELLFQDDNPRSNTDPVVKATRSPDATRKAGRRRTRQQEPCHTIASLFDELENRTRNTIRVKDSEATFPQLSTPTELQARALALIDERVPQIT